MKRLLLIWLVLFIPSFASAATCAVSSTYPDGSIRYVQCTKGQKGKKGDAVTVTPTPAPTPTPSGPVVITVAPGTGTLTAALVQARTAAQAGPVSVVLTAGDYIDNVDLAPAAYPITLTAAESLLPAPGVRVTPTYVLPRIWPKDLFTATITVRGDYYTFRALEIESPGVGYTTIELDADSQPKHTTFDQMLIRGNPTTGGHRGIAANGVDVVVTNSWIDRMWEVGRDAQAIAAWDTPGPIRVENSYLEASGENFLLGGALPTTCGCVVADVTFTRNDVRKDLAWRSMSTPPQVKNLFEVKAGRRIVVTGNTFRYTWMNAQTGWAILFTSQSDSGPLNAIEDVRVEGNRISDVSSGLEIAAVSGPVRRITVVNNVWENLDYVQFGGDGRFAILLAGTAGTDDITLAHNTVRGLTGNQFLGLYGDVPIQRLVMTGNIVEQREYGIHSVTGLASNALATAAPGAVFVDNAIIGPPVYYLPWPAGNAVLDVSLADHLDAAGGVLGSSPLATLPTSDGVTVGADVSKVAR